MIRKTIPVLFLLIFLTQLGVQEALSKPEYLTNLTTVYGNGSCATCHVNPSGGGTLTSYGQLFANQPDHAADPSSALVNAGAPPGMNATPTATGTAVATAGATTTAVATVTATAVATVTATAVATVTEIPIETPTPAITLVSTPVETVTTVITAVATPTPRTPGFGLVVSVAGLLVCFLLLRRRN